MKYSILRKTDVSFEDQECWAETAWIENYSGDATHPFSIALWAYEEARTRYPLETYKLMMEMDVE